MQTQIEAGVYLQKEISNQKTHRAHFQHQVALHDSQFLKKSLFTLYWALVQTPIFFSSSYFVIGCFVQTGDMNMGVLEVTMLRIHVLNDI